MTTTWSIQRAGESWNPASALSTVAQRIGRPEWPSARLGDLVEVIHAESLPLGASEWVSPESVSSASGAATASLARRPDRSGYLLDLNLEVGDLLVPRHGGRPSLLVDASCEGIAFTQGFIALRPQLPLDPAALWGLLASHDGIEIRQQLLVGSTVENLPLRALLDVKLGVPPAEFAERARQLLPSPRVEPARHELSRTLWATSRIADGQWAEHLTEAAAGSSPTCRLSDVAIVVAGRVRNRDRSELPLPGFVPVCLPSNVRRADWRPTAWALRVEPVTDGRSIVIPAVRRFRAGVPPPGWVLGHDTYLVSPLPETDATDLLGWLSAHGEAVLDRLAMGTIMPRLPVTVLRSIRVPDPLPQATESATDEVDLANRIHVIWK